LGKKYIAYQRYIKAVPKDKRTKNSHIHPRTPDKNAPCSVRSWNGYIRRWRHLLHQWDPPATEKEKEAAEIDEDGYKTQADGDTDDDDGMDVNFCGNKKCKLCMPPSKKSHK
jgi:hypothetical protein